MPNDIPEKVLLAINSLEACIAQVKEIGTENPAIITPYIERWINKWDQALSELKGTDNAIY